MSAPYDRDMPAVTRRSMFPLRWWMPLVAFFGAYVIRVFHIGQVVNFLDDRWANVPTAFNYARFGLTGPDNWFTQPVKHLLMYWNILIFGNTPVGWSMRQVLFGSAVVLMTYLLARRVFRAHFPALAAACLVALDPLSISFSRASSEDPLAVFFILAAFFFWVRAIQENRDTDWLASGVLIGVASATRWYALLVAVLMFGIALFVHRKEGAGVLAKIGSLLSLVPLSAYVVWFLPWMSRGYSLGDLWLVQLDSFLVQRTGEYPAFDPALDVITGPAGWFFRWIGVGTNPLVRTFTVIMNDPVLWVLFVPGVAFLLWMAYKRRLPEYWLLGGSFVVLYTFFITANRPIYLYSALSIVPLGFMAVGYSSGRLLRRWSLPLLAAAVIWSAYLYPLTSAVTVPLAPYAWLLEKVGMLGGGR